MNILMLLAFGSDTPCTNAPVVDSISNTLDNLDICLGGTGFGWQIEWTAVLASGSLQPGQQLYWEEATNAAGDNWAFIRYSNSLSIREDDETLGSTGGGATETHYRKVRAYVVPTGGNPSNACSGPVTSSQIQQTGKSCI